VYRPDTPGDFLPLATTGFLLLTRTGFDDDDDVEEEEEEEEKESEEEEDEDTDTDDDGEIKKKKIGVLGTWLRIVKRKLGPDRYFHCWSIVRVVGCIWRAGGGSGGSGDHTCFR